MDRPISINLLSPTVGRKQDWSPDMVMLPYLSDHKPTFEAKIVSRDGAIEAKGIQLCVNREQTEFDFDELTGIWSWTPSKQLPEGTLLVEIWARDTLDNRTYNCWKLKIDSTPPEVVWVFPSGEDNELTICLNEPEYLSVLQNRSFWNSKKYKDDKDTDIPIIDVKPVGGNPTIVRIKLAEDFWKTDVDWHDVKLTGPRGETKFGRGKDKDKEISDLDGWAEYCWPPSIHEEQIWNIACPDDPNYEEGSMRIGNCWRTNPAQTGDSAGPDDFPDHTYQSMESESHCFGSQFLGTVDAQTTPSGCYCYGEIYEDAYVNTNRGPEFFNLTTEMEDLQYGEDAQTAIIDPPREFSGWGGGYWPYNVTEMLQQAYIGSPWISRIISTEYRDYGYIGAAGNKLLDAAVWDFEGDHFNPIFVTPPALETNHSLMMQHAAGYSDFVDNIVEPEHCCWVWFEYRDVGADGMSSGSMYSYENLGIPGGQPNANVMVGLENPEDPGVIVWLNDQGIRNEYSGMLDLAPLVGTGDPDGLPGEQFIWAHELYSILNVAKETKPNGQVRPLYTPGDPDVTLYFKIQDGAGNWKKATLDLHQELSYTEPSFSDMLDDNGEFGSSVPNVHVFDQLDDDNLPIQDVSVVTGVYKTGGNFFFPPNADTVWLENQMNKKCSNQHPLKVELQLTCAESLRVNTIHMDDLLTGLLCDALESGFKSKDSCEASYYSVKPIYGENVSTSPPTSLYVSDEDYEDNPQETRLDPQNRWHFITVSGNDSKYGLPQQFNKIHDANVSGFIRKGSGRNDIRVKHGKDKAVNTLIYNDTFPSYPSTPYLGLTGGIELVSVYRNSPDYMQQRGLALRSGADLVVFLCHGKVKGLFGNGRRGIATLNDFLHDKYRDHDEPYADAFTPSILSGYYDEEQKWLVLAACAQLDYRVAPGEQHSAAWEWDNKLVGNGDGDRFVEGLCGHPHIDYIPHSAELASRFCSTFDRNRLPNPALYIPNLPNHPLWPSDPAVITWMEEAYHQAMRPQSYFYMKWTINGFRQFSRLNAAAHDVDRRWELVCMTGSFHIPTLITQGQGKIGIRPCSKSYVQ